MEAPLTAFGDRTGILQPMAGVPPTTPHPDDIEDLQPDAPLRPNHSPVDEDTAPPTTRVERRRARRRWFDRPVLVIAAVTAIAGGLRFYHLSSPHAFVFDEVYYAKDGCFDAGFPYKDCKLDHPGEQTLTVHPPLGRWIIAGGEAAFGNRPFGWRFASAVAGTLSVTLLAILAYVLFQSALWAGVAGMLLATENLNFVQSRISMLDIFVALFVVAGMLFLVLDRRWIERRHPSLASGGTADIDTLAEPDLDLPPDRPPAPIFRPWRLACGVALGAATATKWSGGTALIAAIVLTLGWERARRNAAGQERPLWETVRDEGFGIFLFLIIVPVAVYLASYARWFADNHVDFEGWWALQQSMAKFSINLRATHPYASAAWSWILLKRPVAYYYVCATPCRRPAEIIALGNPLIFWGSIPALLYTAVAWLRRARLGAMPRAPVQVLLATAASVMLLYLGLVAMVVLTGFEWTALTVEKATLLVGALSFTAFLLMLLASMGRWQASFIIMAVAWQYFPWFFASRTNFLFYMTPVTPFLVLGCVFALKRLAEFRIGLDRVRAVAPIAGFLAVASVGLFVFFLPVLTGAPISYEMWKARMWFPSWV
jgi:dolichyl-phosphate-mannose-protein mannosyltransferase